MMNLFKEFRNALSEVENLLIFVSDAFRWGYLPEEIAKKGITMKTIASSIFTASSFPSIVTGLYPCHHKVASFTDRLSGSVNNILKSEGHTISLYTETTWSGANKNNALKSILRTTHSVSLKEISTPFIFIEHDKGGHCPYGYTFEEYSGSFNDFFQEYSYKSVEKLREAYQKSIQESVKQFTKRLNTVHERGLSGSTLVIFTSDHGELLGEYGGLVGHGYPACPELVYVPTVFIHPSLPKGMEIDSGVFRHVDIYPTLADLLNIDKPDDSDGISLFKVNKLPQLGYSSRKGLYIENPKDRLRSAFQYSASSIWNKDGGYVFHKLTPFRGVIRAIYITLLNSDGNLTRYIRGRMKRRPWRIFTYPYTLRQCVAPVLKYGSPAISRKRAELEVEKIETKTVNIEKETAKLSEEVKQRLRDLGYID